MDKLFTLHTWGLSFMRVRLAGRTLNFYKTNLLRYFLVDKCPLDGHLSFNLPAVESGSSIAKSVLRVNDFIRQIKNTVFSLMPTGQRGSQTEDYCKFSFWFEANNFRLLEVIIDEIE